MKAIIESKLKMGTSPIKLLGILREAMDEVGKKFENGEFFLSDLVMAGEIMKEASGLLEPYLKTDKTAAKGIIVIGTIEGDLHDIGKNIVNSVLTGAGYEVHDLGIDVPPEKFAKETEKLNADIVAISALLSTTVPTSEKVVMALERIGLRKRVKIIIGGAAVRKWMIKEYGVDAAVNDVYEGLEIINSWMNEK